MAYSTKKPWIKPEIRQYETPEEILAHYREGLSDADLQTLVELAEQMQRSARRGVEFSRSVRLAKK